MNTPSGSLGTRHSGHDSTDRLDSLIAAVRGSTERRAVYRAQPEQADQVEVRLHVGCADQPVMLMDISALGAHLFVSSDACRKLQEGGGRSRPVIHLSLHAGLLDRPLRLTARVVERRPVAHGYHLHLQFVDALACGADVDERLRALFNRRAALRVPAPVDPPIRLRLAMPGTRRPLAGVLLDASLTGVGIGLPVVAPDLDVRHRPVSVILRLPGARTAATLRGRVRSWRSLVDVAMPASSLGVQFDSEASDGCRCSRDLARYVVARQLELRREQASVVGGR